MTDTPYEPQGGPDGEEARAPSPPGSFGDEAAELADEPFERVAAQPPQEPTEVEEDLTAADELAVTLMALAERTSDLQRLQAEFVNYKRRVDRDRDLIRENATYTALAPITEVLDTIDRAREHAPLEDGFRAVADQLERIVTSLGLTKFGAVGDPFDPTIHEALSHIGEDPEVSVTTCKVIAKAGYRIGNRVVRAAQVLVVDPPSVDPPSVAPTSDPARGDQGDPDSAPTE
ncbi:MAG: GrpE protein cofactor [Nocardioides sp.]|nr:GrpE protein cofactor [Nocardioides sp.]